MDSSEETQELAAGMEAASSPAAPARKIRSQFDQLMFDASLDHLRALQSAALRSMGTAPPKGAAHPAPSDLAAAKAAIKEG